MESVVTGAAGNERTDIALRKSVSCRRRPTGSQLTLIDECELCYYKLTNEGDVCAT